MTTALTVPTKAKDCSTVATYSSHTAAEAAIKELQSSGFDMKKLSIVGRDYHTDEHVVGYYNTGDRMKAWGKWAPTSTAPAAFARHRDDCGGTIHN